MNAKDQIKVINEGFLIIRERDEHFNEKGNQYFIYAKSKGKIDWYKRSGPYKSKAQRRRIMKTILTQQLSVED